MTDDDDGGVSDTNGRTRKRRREVRDKYKGIRETMDAYIIDPWFPLNEQGFITLVMDTWN
ncbi:hypothetical protein NX059_012270 [Plenodomus lindquistii]|nr:hypothetical protein NX059_012270 [Plenodomus lindquistii]